MLCVNCVTNVNNDHFLSLIISVEPLITLPRSLFWVKYFLQFAMWWHFLSLSKMLVILILNNLNGCLLNCWRWMLFYCLKPTSSRVWMWLFTNLGWISWVPDFYVCYWFARKVVNGTLYLFIMFDDKKAREENEWKSDVLGKVKYEKEI